MCLPGLTHVSSLHKIENHCSSVQSSCSIAHWSREIWFAYVKTGFRRAIRRAKPSFLNAVRIAWRPTFHWKIEGISAQEVRRFALDAVTYWIRRFRWGVFKWALQPRKWCWGVNRVHKAYCTWRRVRFNWRAISSWVQPASKYRVWHRNRSSREVCCVGVLGVGTLNEGSMTKVLIFSAKSGELSSLYHWWYPLHESPVNGNL